LPGTLSCVVSASRGAHSWRVPPNPNPNPNPLPQVVVLAESLCLRLPGQPELCAAIMAHVVEGDARREEGTHRCVCGREGG
jgi:hypothetical protein